MDGFLCGGFAVLLESLYRMPVVIIIYVVGGRFGRRRSAHLLPPRISSTAIGFLIANVRVAPPCFVKVRFQQVCHVLRHCAEDVPRGCVSGCVLRHLFVILYPDEGKLCACVCVCVCVCVKNCIHCEMLLKTAPLRTEQMDFVGGGGSGFWFTRDALRAASGKVVVRCVAT